MEQSASDPNPSPPQQHDIDRLEGIQAIMDAAREDRRSEAVELHMRPPAAVPTLPAAPPGMGPLTSKMLGSLLARGGPGGKGQGHSSSSISSLTSSTPGSDDSDSPANSLACSRQASFERSPQQPQPPPPPTCLPWGGCVPMAYLSASLQQPPAPAPAARPQQHQQLQHQQRASAAAVRGKKRPAAGAQTAAGATAATTAAGGAHKGRAKACATCHAKKGTCVLPAGMHDISERIP
jgi:hypothetical protein